MKTKCVLSLIVYAACSGTGVYAQEAAQAVPREAVIRYLNQVDDYAVIYSGKEQSAYVGEYTNDPYLVTAEFQKGELRYGGILYPEVSMRYDRFRDELILQIPSNPFNIVLEKEKVEGARVNGYRIIRHYAGDWVGISQGNYLLLLHEGRYPVLRKDFLQHEQKIEDKRVINSFRPRERFYVYKDNVCHPVTNKRSLLKLFPERRRELDAYARQQKLNFRKQREQAVIAMIEYVEQISQ